MLQQKCRALHFGPVRSIFSRRCWPPGTISIYASNIGQAKVLRRGVHIQKAKLSSCMYVQKVRFRALEWPTLTTNGCSLQSSRCSRRQLHDPNIVRVRVRISLPAWVVSSSMPPVCDLRVQRGEASESQFLFTNARAIGAMKNIGTARVC